MVDGNPPWYSNALTAASMKLGKLRRVRMSLEKGRYRIFKDFGVPQPLGGKKRP